ncbi:hypothetical protein QOT17_017778 [Balamuthia mandrillaris]
MQSNGKRVSNPLNIIIVQPNPAVKQILDCNQDKAVMEKISEHVGKNYPLIGTPACMETSELTTSLWGDKYLAFQQQKFDDDLMVRPEWKSYFDDDYLMYEGVPDKYEDYIPAWN